MEFILHSIHEPLAGSIYSYMCTFAIYSNIANSVNPYGVAESGSKQYMYRIVCAVGETNTLTVLRVKV